MFLIRKYDVKYTIMEKGNIQPSPLKLYFTKYSTTKIEDNNKLKLL